MAATTTSDPGEYELAANRCVETVDRLRRAVEVEGMKLEWAVRAANLGLLRDDA